ncbi:MAG: hypothetical protein FWD75_04595 [Propionibacteriaceae bacterium]|nr:hypothetical protein [Propionibacteriaceae bacterium]
MGKGKGIVSVAVGVAVGAVAGVAGLTAHAETPVVRDQASAQQQAVAQLAEETGLPSEALEVRTNSAGLTYGSGLVAEIQDGKMPDLVGVIMDDGQEGYVYSSELQGPMPANPEEAVKMMQERDAAVRAGVDVSRTLVATDEEGNPIGTFTVQG